MWCYYYLFAVYNKFCTSTSCQGVSLYLRLDVAHGDHQIGVISTPDNPLATPKKQFGQKFLKCLSTVRIKIGRIRSERPFRIKTPKRLEDLYEVQIKSHIGVQTLDHYQCEWLFFSEPVSAITTPEGYLLCRMDLPNIFFCKVQFCFLGWRPDLLSSIYLIRIWQQRLPEPAPRHPRMGAGTRLSHRYFCTAAKLAADFFILDLQFSQKEA